MLRGIAALSPDEARALCEKVNAYRRATDELPGARKVRCGTDALGAAGAIDNTTPEAMRASCKATYDACVANPSPLPTMDCASFVDMMKGCGDLSADELFACSEEMRRNIAAVADDVDPCAGPLDPKDPLASYNAYTAKLKGATCAPVERKCGRAK